MSFRVLVTRTAARLAEHLPEAAAAACVEFLFGPLADNPRRVGAELRPPFAGQWRARRGEYRVRYRIEDGEDTVYVLDIDHRSSIIDETPIAADRPHRPRLGLR